jgi:hypothetical protein
MILNGILGLMHYPLKLSKYNPEDTRKIERGSLFGDSLPLYIL